ncbi:MAG: hypothetical protein IT581_18565 [Verrucomicrobiales bacterium]|nr:hypothetical protein [Verrucomicrobiales bacterium]
MKSRNLLPVLGAAALSMAACLNSPAGIILQQTGAAFVAFEAENTTTRIQGTPETWETRSDSGASGGNALAAGGTNSTGDSPHSFAQYQIKFATAGTYYLYYRWKTEEARTAGDNATANSSWIPLAFGDLKTPGADAQTSFTRTDSNNTTAPANNAYAWRREIDAVVYNVDAATLTAAQTFSVGTREAGMMFDRFVFSTEPALTDAQLESLANSPSDVIEQSGSDTFIAFEAETVQAKLIAGTPETWERRSDGKASSGGALVAGGTNSTGDSPHSFAQYQLRFAKAGTYYLYYRWKTEEARTAGDNATANSSWIPNAFGDLHTPGADAQPSFTRTDSNNTTAPANNAYAWRREPDAVVYAVADAQANTVQIWSLGTREAGMTFDRFVFSTEPALTDAQLDSLANSGSKPVPPEVATVAGSEKLTEITIKFTRPLSGATVVPANFSATGLAISAATLDTEDARIVKLTTSAQTEGAAYVVAVTGVKDTSGTTVAAGTQASFTAWKRVNGWVTREIYFNITGTDLQALLDAPDFQARKASRVEYLRAFAFDQDPVIDNFGVRLIAFFQPPTSGTYDFHVAVDDVAQLQLSTDETEAALSALGDFTITPREFSDASSAASGSLTTGKRYLLTGLMKQNGGESFFSVGARRQGDATPLTSLPALTGASVSTWVNPDLGKVKFLAQPADATVSETSRAQFVVRAEAAVGPLFYQWQENGANLPGANRATYITKTLATADSGKKYRCIVSAGGIDNTSAEAVLTVRALPSGTYDIATPIVGINFVGGGNSNPGPMQLEDVAGVYPQDHWSNLTGFTFDNAALTDGAGKPSPITLTTATLTETWYSGTFKSGDANGMLFQGFVTAGSPTEPVTLTLANVPAPAAGEEYRLLLYTIGFDFTPAYEQDYTLTGSGTYPAYKGRSQTGLQFVNNPTFVRMQSVDAAARDSGNYVQFDKVVPASDQTLSLSVTWAGSGGNSHQPAINALQLVSVKKLVVEGGQPTIKLTRSGTDVRIEFDGVLQSSSEATAGFADVAGAKSPLVISPADARKFYRARR